MAGFLVRNLIGCDGISFLILTCTNPCCTCSSNILIGVEFVATRVCKVVLGYENVVNSALQNFILTVSAVKQMQ